MIRDTTSAVACSITARDRMLSRYGSVYCVLEALIANDSRLAGSESRTAAEEVAGGGRGVPEWAGDGGAEDEPRVEGSDGDSGGRRVSRGHLHQRSHCQSTVPHRPRDLSLSSSIFPFSPPPSSSPEAASSLFDTSASSKSRV